MPLSLVATLIWAAAPLVLVSYPPQTPPRPSKKFPNGRRDVAGWLLCWADALRIKGDLVTHICRLLCSPITRCIRWMKNNTGHATVGPPKRVNTLFPLLKWRNTKTRPFLYRTPACKTQRSVPFAIFLPRSNGVGAYPMRKPRTLFSFYNSDCEAVPLMQHWAMERQVYGGRECTLR